ncbi:FliH/SctL family protein [Kistimonas asteriae]|uniref:FliH/SctL family protein n=1 Tax=Kistimonas asteriae TaxID=517724 RepID=UPI001BA63AD2|nr:FliH/SctL family protein [Kistimonas asteriae]
MKQSSRVIRGSEEQCQRVSFPAFRRPPRQDALEVRPGETEAPPSRVVQEPLAADSDYPDINALIDQHSAYLQANGAEGFADGYRQGMALARKDGYEQGQQKGLEDGRTEGLAEGRQEGFEQGLQEGINSGREQAYKEALANSEQEINALVTQLNGLLSNVRHLYENRRDEMSEWLSTLIETIVRQIIRSEPKSRPEQIYRVVRNTLQSLPGNDGTFQIYLNPVDSERLLQFKPELREQWEIFATPEIEPGNCRIENGELEAEANIEQRIQDCLDMVRLYMPDEVEERLS